MDGETVELLSNADVAAGSIPFNLYVRYEPAWQPNDVAARGSFLLGSDDEDSVRPEVVRVSDTIGSKKCYISGLVVRPGAYPLTAPKTVYEALAEAGGLTDFAKASKIYVLRGQEKIPFNYNEVKKGRGLQQNIRLQNGDVVVVP